MKIKVENCYSYIEHFESLYPEIRKELQKLCSFREKGCEHMAAYKAGRWDGRTYLLSDKGRFATGLLGIIQQYCKEQGIQYGILDRRYEPALKHTYVWSKKIKLRDYQKEAVARLLEIKRGIIELPTRSGKTYMAAKVIHEVKMRCLYMVNSQESLLQAEKDLKECFKEIKISHYGGGKRDLSGQVIIGLIQSMRTMTKAELSQIEDVGLVIIDEVHKAAAKTVYDFFMKIDAPYRLGMSGTPFREDNKDLKMIGLVGRFIYVKSQEEMWEKGVIEKPKVRWITINPDNGARLHRAIPYQHHYVLGVIHYSSRNNWIDFLVSQHLDAQILISVESLEHGEVLLELLKPYNAVFVSGKSPKKVRIPIYEAIQSGKARVVIASRIFNESLTFPDLAVLINAAGRQSGVELIQKYGRTQGKGNKGQVYIYDFMDNHSHYLLRHSKKRMSILRERGYEMSVFKKEDMGDHCNSCGKVEFCVQEEGK